MVRGFQSVNPLPCGWRQRGPIRSVEVVTVARQPVYAKRHLDQRARPICQLILFREQLHPLNPVYGQQPQAKGPRLSPGNRPHQKPTRDRQGKPLCVLEKHVDAGALELVPFPFVTLRGPQVGLAVPRLLSVQRSGLLPDPDPFSAVLIAHPRE